MVTSERIELPAAQVCLEKPFSQIFLTDTDRHHIHRQDTSFAAMKTFVVSDGTINEDNE